MMHSLTGVSVPPLRFPPARPQLRKAWLARAANRSLEDTLAGGEDGAGSGGGNSCPLHLSDLARLQTAVAQLPSSMALHAEAAAAQAALLRDGVLGQPRYGASEGAGLLLNCGHLLALGGRAEEAKQVRDGAMGAAAIVQLFTADSCRLPSSILAKTRPRPTPAVAVLHDRRGTVRSRVRRRAPHHADRAGADHQAARVRVGAGCVGGGRIRATRTKIPAWCLPPPLSSVPKPARRLLLSLPPPPPCCRQDRGPPARGGRVARGVRPAQEGGAAVA
jgi:hypothetical protein